MTKEEASTADSRHATSHAVALRCLDSKLSSLALAMRFEGLALTVRLFVSPPLSTALFIPKDLHFPNLNPLLTFLQCFFSALPRRSSMARTYRHSNRLLFHGYVPQSVYNAHLLQLMFSYHCFSYRLE